MNLTDREHQIVALLRRDPMIGSAAIAEQLGTTRAAVNVHLSNLGKKGVILGRGYLLSEQPGRRGDRRRQHRRQGAQRGARHPAHQQPRARLDDARRGGRNVAENLARLGTRTHLVAAVGRDAWVTPCWPDRPRRVSGWSSSSAPTCRPAPTPRSSTPTAS